eukprot:8050818-Ditylum_brightwellii.AAC.1
MFKQDNGDDSQKSKKGKKRKNICATKIRYTVAQNSVPPLEDVHLLMKSDGEESGLDNEVTSGQICASRVNKAVRANKPSDSSTNKDFCRIIIFDSGTEWTVIGDPAWSIRKLYNRPLNMSAVGSNMSSVAMKTCDGVTAMKSGDGQTWLMGIRCGAYSPTLTNDKEVVNNHLVCEAGWKLDCVAKQHGGSQCIWFPDGNKVPLEYDANKYKLFVMCRHPTTYTLRMIPIHWVDCHIEDLEIDDGTKPVRKKN